MWAGRNASFVAGGEVISYPSTRGGGVGGIGEGSVTQRRRMLLRCSHSLGHGWFIGLHVAAPGKPN